MVVSISEMKARLSAFVDRVRAGETLTITDRGVPVAQLAPLVGVETGDGGVRLAQLERAGVVLRPGAELDVESFLARPRAKARASVLEMLLEERRESGR